ncbi:apolipoprotein N-acyltransferase [Paraferrimonas sp. SM1919]|uniref:apolipoprotein N-acyltransferase n=1 Tax=Paraferrimonas sp. SM1919 TaxID=2662263 RepID=UPI0013D07BC6|nr:apolipoprotein N-acyltransferase [Paraferrimonas sp. SM1919]
MLQRLVNNGHLLASFAAGAATLLAYAPFGIWPVILLSFIVPLHFSQPQPPAAAAKTWFAYGLGKFCFGISWVHVSIDTYGGLPIIVSLLIMLLLCAYLALFSAASGYLLQRLNPQHKPLPLLLLFAPIWTAFEWLRGTLLTGFPWLWEGYALIDSPLALLANSIGALGLTLLLVQLATGLYLFLKKQWSAVLLPVILLTITFIVSNLNKPQLTEQQVDVVLVQGNIPQSLKWQPENLWPTMFKYLDLTRADFDADIIVWPEAAIPAPMHMVSSFVANAHKAATFHEAALITGIIAVENDTYFNRLITLGQAASTPVRTSQSLTEPERSIAIAPYINEYSGADVATQNNQYDKHHLLPVGEFVPFEDWLRPLAPFFNLPMSSFARGDLVQPNLNAKGYQLLPAICYEIAFPEQLRANLTANTDFLLTVSNDAWFGESVGPVQHMQIAQMRAIELGRPLLRATNNGVTAVVDSYGTIQKQIPQFETGVLRHKVNLVSGDTIFARYGHWTVLLVSIILMIQGLRHSWSREP